MNKRKIIPYVTVFIALLVWIYFKPEAVIPTTPKHYPSYIGYNVSNVHFDEFGNISHKMFADKVTNYVEKDKTILVNPKAIVYMQNKKTKNMTSWQITAKDGVMYGQQKLILSDHVFVDNLTKDQLVQTMKTDTMIVQLDIKELSTDDAIYWTGPEMKQEGVGMWGSFATEEMIVKSKVKAVYYNTKGRKKK